MSADVREFGVGHSLYQVTTRVVISAMSLPLTQVLEDNGWTTTQVKKSQNSFTTFSRLSHEERVRPTLSPLGVPVILKQHTAKPPCFPSKGQGSVFTVLEKEYERCQPINEGIDSKGHLQSGL